LASVSSLHFFYLHYYRGQGLWLSTNGGSSWSNPAPYYSSEDDTYWRGSFALSPSDNNIACILSFCEAIELLLEIDISVSPQNGVITGVYKTTNMGTSWTQVLEQDSTLAGRLNQALLSNTYYAFFNPTTSTKIFVCFN
jgi:hypothetical protein